MLAGKRITVGVTGGIAAYKAADLVSTLVKAGAEVHVAMTSSAQQFITPLTFEVLTGNPVATNLFEKSPEGAVLHIDLAQRADLMVIVPATANIIGKAANGIADDLVSTLIVAASCPVLFCPAMNVVMYHNPLVQSNINKLKDLGYAFVEPEEGRLACGTSGKGRLADTGMIMNSIQKLVTPQDLAGLKVLVTAGPTREPLDPVRYLSNRSSGKMGYALAKVASLRGATVTLVSGPTALTPPPGVETISVTTAEQMFQEVIQQSAKAQLIIKAAAVADYRPLVTNEQKIKKQGQGLSLELTQNPDILAQLGQRKGRQQLLVGFAAETNDLEQNALSKLKRKNLDLLVANDVTQPGAGFDHDTNIVRIFDQSGEVKALPRLSKEQVAWEILNLARELFQARGI
ncbi:bifunctional phosphopantothenoylcysteine decarboxylase/phosphopantothenate--cysteine ligase CoaBC [Desulforamulus ferrireducens]|uniref:Coenzyme A biosynthesis bifunctional protein CoaBC n=1 Tax=Desulforamulus ferrireducens TaxID=1833852 RepID=A0A1S6J0J4_9FIRM|nr:bifunctional phosphopantothenoylcysteine decarboxylase/phosphopantothenate--cysteine ligase CoaBC [Desulforamulus ferrireducens]AQS60551.1 bifunctional 4'-phosphopantothenoylcysteine decarboxylase/phosphopantothenoylcysteine synthetase [Desulforamulus ferrireducens]